MGELKLLEQRALGLLSDAALVKRAGRLTAIQGMVLEAAGVDVQIGEIVEVIPARGGEAIAAEVVGLRAERTLLMPYGPIEGLCLASAVIPSGQRWSVAVGPELLGRVIDATGNPLEGAPFPSGMAQVKRAVQPINPLARRAIDRVMETGVKAVDIFTPIGRGQRVGIFAGSGVGKSTLLGMISKRASADVIVIALIGERGREVGEFLRESLGAEGREHAVVVAASSDQPAVLRRQAAYTAGCIAEWFRDQGKDVLLIMDSVTRFALAQREIALAIGEPMGSRGYPPSCFALLPPLLERAGNIEGKGSITGVYTVLVEGDDINEPVADHMRAILDGHIVLDRKLASRGHYPPIDVLGSISRLADKLWKPAQRTVVERVKATMATYQDQKDLIDLGAYEKGSNPVLDRAIELKPEFDALLRQRSDEQCQLQLAWQQAQRLAERAPGGRQ
ncbi:MAG: putative flagellum-specific synthase [Microvirga sp.]|jgi:flagellum-specific ATP synthase|nr:putative flagellum-specific synthase [Microvirga sp.]